MCMVKKISCILLVAMLPILAIGQSTVTVKYFGCTIHPFGDKSAALMPYKFDSKGRFIANFGGFIGYEKYIYEDFISAKIIQGIFTDCSGGLAGVTHLGLRGVLIDKNKHRFSFGIGPVFLYRDSWSRFGERYTPSGFFNEYHSGTLGDVQWKFFYFGFEFEYDYLLNQENDLSFSFTPGLPMACVFSVGVKHWFSKDFKKTLKFAIPDTYK
jgi:hypothetical protein